MESYICPFKKEIKSAYFFFKTVYSTDASNEEVYVYTWSDGRQIFGLFRSRKMAQNLNVGRNLE